MAKNNPTRRMLGFSIALFLSLFWGYRVWCVNAQAESIPRIYYETGEWIPVEDGYIVDELVEKNDGYFFRINGAEIMSPKEFVTRFSKDDLQIESIDESDDQTVLAVSITMRNDCNTEGGLESFMWSVISDSNNCEYRVSDRLFKYVEDVGQRFRIREGTEYTTVFPFMSQTPPQYLSSPYDYGHGTVLGDRFTLNLTVRPVKKTAQIVANGISR